MKPSVLFSQKITHANCIELVPKDEYYPIISYRFRNIKQRTSNPNNNRYKYYGGRGISCQFECLIDFYDYVYEDFVRCSKLYGYRNITIDRIDNDGDYAKGNIRLVTMTVQQSNTRRNKYFLATKDAETVLANNAMVFGRYSNTNGRSVGNALRTKKTEFNGWTLKIITKEEADKILNSGSVTTNLLK